MSEKNLPIKLVLQRTSDTQKNQGGGGIKFFCEVTKELQDVMTEKFEGVLSYYESVFQESELIPAVGKITVRPEAIGKRENVLFNQCGISIRFGITVKQIVYCRLINWELVLITQRIKYLIKIGFVFTDVTDITFLRVDNADL